jgi:hypothetical protein
MTDNTGSESTKATPAQQLVDLICEALSADNVVGSLSIGTLKQQMLSGKAKAEDWYLAIETNLEVITRGNSDGK